MNTTVLETCREIKFIIKQEFVQKLVKTAKPFPGRPDHSPFVFSLSEQLQASRDLRQARHVWR